MRGGRDLRRLLRPRHVAVLGGGWAANVLRTLRGSGFAGQVWPVHPSRDAIEGFACLPSLAELPEAPDAVFVGVNRDATVGVVRDLAAMGAGGAVCFSSGWGEVADGAERQRALVQAAGDMPVLGPNCYGFINYLDGAALWPDVHGGLPIERGVGIIAQSSNIAINLTMQRRGLPLAYLLTLGNGAQTGVAELVEALLDDGRVTAIGLHLEGFGDAPRLEAALRRAHAQRVPVVALKVGASAAAQAMTLSHTATLAGPDHLASAFLARCAAVRVQTLEEMVETLKLLHVLGPSPDATLGSMSCSGGEASLVADLARTRGLDLRPLTALETARVRETANPLVTVSNPFDYHTFDWGNAERLAATYAAFLRADLGLTLLLLDLPREDRCDASAWAPALEAAVRARKETRARLAVVSSLPENLPETLAAGLMAEGIAPLNGLDAALAAAAHAAWLGQARPAAEPLAKPMKVDRVPATTLDEAEAKALLKAAGLAVPEARFALDAAAAVADAEALGYPLALKAVRRRIAHKTEAGAVALNLGDARAVADAAARMAHLQAPFLVEHMVEGAVAELILGVGRDPALGLFLTVGSGGVLVELLQDSVTLLLPVTREEVRAALASLTLAPLLTGFRGRPAGDIDAVLDAAMAVAGFALAHADRLEELDINPLLVTPSGAFAADALLRLHLLED